MPKGYYRNVDDSYSDPELIATQYQVGRNAFFEVQLTLAEFADSIQSGTGGLAGSPDIAQSLAEGTGVIGCPHIDQYIWIEGMQAVKASNLIDTNIPVYNPLTRNFNRVRKARLLPNQSIVKLTTAKGIENIVSTTHQIIRNTADRTGASLMRYDVNQEILSFDEGKTGKNKNWSIYDDVLIARTEFGFGDVVEIELEDEWIYASGSTEQAGIVAHNRKQFDPNEPLA